MTGVEGKIALVTGASRGIGLETARLLMEKGARVMGVARSESDLQASGLEHYMVADLSTEQGCTRAIQATLNTFGGIDILIVNHGIGSAHEVPLYKQPLKDFEQAIFIFCSIVFFRLYFFRRRRGACTHQYSGWHWRPGGKRIRTSHFRQKL